MSGGKGVEGEEEKGKGEKVRRKESEGRKAKSEGMSEDDQKFWEAEVQDLTDKMIKAVDAALETKQAEIMQV